MALDLSLWDVSKRQVKILTFIREYLLSTDHRMGPSQREIGRAVGITEQAVGHQLLKLKKKGYLQYHTHERKRRIRRVRLPGEPPLN